MKQTGIPFIILCLFIASCGEKKEETPGKQFLSARSIIEQDIANIDTSLFSIMRLDIIDSSRTDTSFVPREKFREVAAEFLTLPDISDKKNSKDYTETSMYDAATGKVILSYQPLPDKKVLLQRQDVAVAPNVGSTSEVSSFYFDYIQVSKDSSIEKKMLWQVNRSFQITTLRQLPAQPEKVTTLRVVWNEPQY